MKNIIVNEKRKNHLNNLLDWLIYMCGYALVLISVSVVFDDTIHIDNSYFGLWALIAVIIIYILNKTIKPLIVWLTLPITGLTLGLFYPFINVFILNVVDFILAEHFEIKGIFMGVIVAIIISLMNILMENLMIEPLLRKDR